jgi:alkylmercury lyase
MADSPDYLPLAEPPADDQALLARAFWLLLDHGRPVELDALAGALQREPATVAAAVDRLEQAGLTRRDPAGRLLGSHGLSVAPTHHELVIDGRRRWSWCAYDAVGILGALEADGRVRSRSPHSGTLIELTFDAGRPAATDAVVFMAEEPCRSVIEDWCPLVNLFEDDQAAAAWARQHGISGAARPVAQATQLGAAAWRAYLWPGATPAGCCPPGAPPTSIGAERRAHGDQD